MVVKELQKPTESYFVNKKAASGLSTLVENVTGGLNKVVKKGVVPVGVAVGIAMGTALSPSHVVDADIADTNTKTIPNQQYDCVLPGDPTSEVLIFGPHQYKTYRELGYDCTKIKPPNIK